MSTDIPALPGRNRIINSMGAPRPPSLAVELYPNVHIEQHCLDLLNPIFMSYMYF